MECSANLTVGWQQGAKGSNMSLTQFLSVRNNHIETMMDGLCPNLGVYNHIVNIVVIIICIVGIFFNAVCIYILFKQKKDSVFHRLLIALAVFDLLYLVTEIFISAPHTNDFYSLPPMAQAGSGNFGFFLRFIMNPIKHVFFVGSSCVTVGCAIERYVAIHYPFKFISRDSVKNNRVVFYYLIPVLIISICFSIPSGYEFCTILPSEADGVIHFLPNQIKIHEHWSIGIIVLSFVQIVVLLFANVKIYLSLRSHNKLLQGVNQAVTSDRTAGERHFFIIIVSIVTLSLVVALPKTFVLVYQMVNPQPSCVLMVFNELISLISVINSTANFLIYSLSANTFRQTIVDEFKKMWGSRGVVSHKRGASTKSTSAVTETTRFVED